MVFLIVIIRVIIVMRVVTLFIKEFTVVNWIYYQTLQIVLATLFFGLLLELDSILLYQYNFDLLLN